MLNRDWFSTSLWGGRAESRPQRGPGDVKGHLIRHHDQIVQRYYQASPIQFGGSITDDAVTSKTRSGHPNFDFGSIFRFRLHRMMIEVKRFSVPGICSAIYYKDPE